MKTLLLLLLATNAFADMYDDDLDDAEASDLKISLPDLKLSPDPVYSPLPMHEIKIDRTEPMKWHSTNVFKRNYP